MIKNNLLMPLLLSVNLAYPVSLPKPQSEQTTEEINAKLFSPEGLDDFLTGLDANLKDYLSLPDKHKCTQENWQWPPWGREKISVPDNKEKLRGLCCDSDQLDQIICNKLECLMAKIVPKLKAEQIELFPKFIGQEKFSNLQKYLIYMQIINKDSLQLEFGKQFYYWPHKGPNRNELYQIVKKENGQAGLHHIQTYSREPSW